MSTDDKILKILEELQSGQKALQADVFSLKDVQQKQGQHLAALQEDVTAIKSETAKISGIEQRLDHHGKLLTGLTASMATALEEQQTQRSDIRTLHTEVHETREELKAEIKAARAEAKMDNVDLKAAVVKKIQSQERRTTNLEEQTGIENPEKH
jgi:chromosome segregation ATPase